MKIAVFDYVLTPTNPGGGCHWRILKALAHEHEFTVFAPQFDNPCPERIKWVKIAPWVRRPAALMYFQYQLVVPFYRLWAKLKGERFDLVQVVTPTILRADVTYSHFCNRAYLKNQWDRCRPSGIRRLLRWMDHRLQAFVEPFALARAKRVVGPCQGLLRELAKEYRECAGKLQLIHNPVDLERMERPAGFDRETARREWNVKPEDTLVAFAALGHFERKGLPLLFSAVAGLKRDNLKLLVIGGEPDVVNTYRGFAQNLGITNNVIFLGRQSDVRPCLWASDVFGFPSYYEAFSISTLEAAATGLPIIAAPINGIEEMLRDGENGFVVEHTSESIAQALNRFMNLSTAERERMSKAIVADVQRFATTNFIARWRELYENYERERTEPGGKPLRSLAQVDVGSTN